MNVVTRIGSLPNSDTVLYQPFIDCLGWMCHENPSTKVCLGKHVGQGGRMVQVKAAIGSLVYCMVAKGVVFRVNSRKDGGSKRSVQEPATLH